ncbi:Importin subunit beta-2 [Hyphodiscus hymeniophilus]|uniref:Importin subunit beta-2 n=1 Tax=Hyphodiscus hymeniophilus TaxID=353542 RepID=A0A9P7AUQ9_9HELO|nr:Importin subunit beta-2 [Hyphodiscus hymeniophilus]
MTATMVWQPQEEPLRQLSSCLKDSLSGYNKNAQKQAEIMLAQAKSSPDINNYLTYLFSSPQAPPGLSYSPDEYHAVRAAAALMLKNNIRTGYKTIPPESVALVRSSIPVALQDKNQSIRSYAGNVITEIIQKGGILGWPQILPELLALIGNDTGNVTSEAQEGAMAALAKVCEDNKKMLDKDYQGQRPLTFIIPKLIQFTANEKPKIRSLALGSINVFIPQKAQALLVNLDDLLNRLFSLASDPSVDVRRQVCRAFVQIVEIRPDKILPHIEGLVDYMIAQQRNVKVDEDLACDAAEFWLTVGEHRELWKSLSPYLNKIIPVLLESMVYSEDDMLMLQGGGNDADEEDRAEDIKPQFAKGKSARINGIGEEVDESSPNGGSYEKLSEMDDGDLDEGEIDESDDDEDGNPEDRWNLRKCSAAALDVFATDFGGPVFETILPYLMTNLKHEEWQFREAAVLALGAVAEGCMDQVTPHLPDLVPYLNSLLKDPEALVRQITCWTLGRYSAWGASLATPDLRTKYFEPMMEGILLTMLDRNKRVQEAAASAFAHLEEKAGAGLTPYCEPIIRQFVQCFERYKDRNMFILYDCVQTLAEHVGHGLAQPQLIELLMPALIHRWNKVSDQSRELFPLLECLSYVANALADTFAPFATPVYTRCIKIIHQNLEEYLAAVNNPILDTPDKDFLVTSLDLLSAIVQAVDDKHAAALVSGSQPRLFDLLQFCMEDPENDVRQSSYALLGDCAKYVFPQLQPFLPSLIPTLIKQLDLDSILEEQIETGFSVVNNACWSCGEIAIQSGKGMGPYVGDLLQRFLEILGNPEVPKSVLENGAIAMGRLGLENAEIMAPVLSKFSEPFLKCISTVDYTLEKATACKGFTLCVLANPPAMEKDLARFCTMIARYQMDESKLTPLTGDLHHIFQHTLETYKRLIPEFGPYLNNHISPADVDLLRTNYNNW